MENTTGNKDQVIAEQQIAEALKILTHHLELNMQEYKNNAQKMSQKQIARNLSISLVMGLRAALGIVLTIEIPTAAATHQYHHNQQKQIELISSFISDLLTKGANDVTTH